MVPGWLHGAKKAAFGHVRPSNVSLYFSLIFLFIRIYIYVYVYYIHINIQRGRPGIPFYPTLCGRVEWAGGSCGRVRPARRPISRLYLTPTRRHTHTDDKPCPKQQPKMGPKSTQNRSQILCLLLYFVGKYGFVPYGKKVALGRQSRTEKKLLWQPFHVLEVALLIWRSYLVALVCPCPFLPCVLPSKTHLYLQSPHLDHKNRRLV